LISRRHCLVECVIALPAKLFYSTKIGVCLWFFNREKRQKGKTLFIDARNLGEYVSRTLKEFTDEDIKKITSTAHAFFSGDGYVDVANFCKTASTEQIAKKNFNLSPTKYVSSSVGLADESDLDVAEHDLAGHVVSIREEISQLLTSFGNKTDIISSLRLPDFGAMSGEELAELIDRMGSVNRLQKIGLDFALTYSEALFRSWFIDFAFPNDDGQSYRENDGAMRKTPYGSIPEQWDVVQLGSILQIRNEKVGERDDVPEYSTTNRGVHLRSENFSKTITKNSGKNKLAYCGDLIFGMSREILNFGVMTDEIGGVSPAYHVYEIDDTKMNPEFLEIYMRICDSYFLSLIKPGAREGQVLDKNEVQSKLILCPPIDLQNQYMLTRKYLSQFSMFGI